MPHSKNQPQHLMLPVSLLKKLELYADGIMAVETLIEQLTVMVLVNLRKESQSLNDGHSFVEKRIASLQEKLHVGQTMNKGKGFGEDRLQNINVRKTCHISRALGDELVTLGESLNLSTPKLLVPLVMLGIELVEKIMAGYGRHPV